MAYSKPKILAKNKTAVVYAAGCGANIRHSFSDCAHCSVSG